jgi:hypothetical protein
MGKKSVLAKKSQPRKPAVLHVNFVNQKPDSDEDPISVRTESEPEGLSFQGMIFGEIVEAIEDAFLYPKNEVYLFELKSSCVYITLDKKHFKHVLGKAILFYERNENYEMCSKCQKLITKIK